MSITIKSAFPLWLIILLTVTSPAAVTTGDVADRPAGA